MYLKGEKNSRHLLAPDVEVEAEKVLDASGKHILPGFIDPHCHMRDPGLTQKEDFLYWNLCGSSFRNYHDHATAEHQTGSIYTGCLYGAGKCRKRKSSRRFNPIGSPLGTAEDVEQIANAGTMWFKIFEKVATYPYNTTAGTLDTHKIFEAFQNCAANGKYCSVHPFDKYFFDAAVEKVKAEGKEVTLRNVRHLWYSDEEMTGAAYQLSYYAKKAGLNWYAMHCWMPGYIDLVRMLKARGEMKIVSSCEYMPAINASDEIWDIENQRFIYINHDAAPDLDKIWEGIQDGTIDMMGSDHAPCKPEEYNPDDALHTSAGFAMLDYYGHLLVSHVNEGHYSLQRLVEITSENCAKTFGLYPRKGSNIVGTDADFTVVDMNEEWEITKDDNVYTKTQTIPYVGRKMHGKVTQTIVRGRIVMSDGVVDCEPGYGKYITVE